MVFRSRQESVATSYSSTVPSDRFGVLVFGVVSALIIGFAYVIRKAVADPLWLHVPEQVPQGVIFSQEGAIAEVIVLWAWIDLSQMARDRIEIGARGCQADARLQ